MEVAPGTEMIGNEVGREEDGEEKPLLDVGGDRRHLDDERLQRDQNDHKQPYHTKRIEFEAETLSSESQELDAHDQDKHADRDHRIDPFPEVKRVKPIITGKNKVRKGEGDEKRKIKQRLGDKSRGSRRFSGARTLEFRSGNGLSLRE